MFIMQTATAALTGLTFTGAAIPAQPADAMIVFICIFVSCFAFSWGPLGWLVSRLQNCPLPPHVTPSCLVFKPVPHFVDILSAKRKDLPLNNNSLVTRCPLRSTLWRHAPPGRLSQCSPTSWPASSSASSSTACSARCRCGQVSYFVVIKACSMQACQLLRLSCAM